MLFIICWTRVQRFVIQVRRSDGNSECWDYCSHSSYWLVFVFLSSYLTSIQKTQLIFSVCVCLEMKFLNLDCECCSLNQALTYCGESLSSQEKVLGIWKICLYKSLDFTCLYSKSLQFCLFGAVAGADSRNAVLWIHTDWSFHLWLSRRRLLRWHLCRQQWDSLLHKTAY